MSDDYPWNRVYKRMWRDPKYRALSDPAEIAYNYILTGPQRVTEGLFTFSAAMAAEDKGWTAEKWSEAFSEVVDATLVKFDPETCTLLLPKALKYPGQAPKNPNVAKKAMRYISDLHWSPLMLEFLAAAERWAPHLHEPLSDWVEDNKPEEPEQPPPNRDETKSEQPSDNAETSISRTSSSSSPRTSSAVDEPSGEQTVNGATVSDASAARSFDDFWSAWPNKRGKKASRGQWASLKPDERERAIDRIDGYRASVPAVKYMKHPERYLRDRIFDDEANQPEQQPDSPLFVALVRVEGGDPSQGTASQRARVQQAALEL